MSCILGAASCEFDIMLAGLDDFFSVWNPYVKMHHPYVTNNMLVEKIGVQKCTSKLRTPVTPIVGRTSEKCHKRLHVCVYAHMDAATLTAWCGKIWCAEMRVKTDDPCDTNSFV